MINSQKLSFVQFSKVRFSRSLGDFKVNNITKTKQKQNPKQKQNKTQTKQTDVGFGIASYTGQIKTPVGFYGNDKNVETMDDEAVGKNGVPLKENLDPSTSVPHAKQVGFSSGLYFTFVGEIYWRESDGLLKLITIWCFFFLCFFILFLFLFFLVWYIGTFVFCVFNWFGNLMYTLLLISDFDVLLMFVTDFDVFICMVMVYGK